MIITDLKHMRRYAMLLVLLIAGWAAGIPAQAASEVVLVPDPNTNLQGEYDGSKIQPLESMADEASGIRIDFSIDGGITAPAYYDNGKNIRLYSGNSFIVSVTDNTFEKIVFHYDANKNSETTLLTENGEILTYDSEAQTYTWEPFYSMTGERLSEARFMINDTQLRISGITVTLTESPSHMLAPVFSKSSGTFSEDFELAIADRNTPEATIRYTLDGSTPDATSGTVYTGPITISAGADVIVKAISVSDNGVSDVSTVTFRYVVKYNLAVKINESAIRYTYISTGDYNGSMEGRRNFKVADGETVDINISLNNSYKFNSITLDGNPLEIEPYNYYNCTFAMPAKDVEFVIDAKFDPSSPGDPQPADTTRLYNVTVVSNPVGAGSDQGSTRLPAGAMGSVYLAAQPGYVFERWSCSSSVVTFDPLARDIDFTMPAEDIVFTAHYYYNPNGPGDPQQPTLKHPLTATVSPAGAGSVRTSSDAVTFGQEYNVYAWPNTGYRFKGWIVNGESQTTTSTTFTGIMTEKGAQVTALFVYDPSSPSSPGANYYNPTTGQAIIDDFSMGNLYQALGNTIGNDNFGNVSSLIVKGRMSANDYGSLGYLTNANAIDLSRTGGTTDIPGYAFQDLAATDISLPASITSIGNYAFSNCSNLLSLTVYAQEPPTCNSYTFSGFTNKNNCTIYVPASAIELYSNAEYWKDFTILPITNDAHILQVNLPADASDGRYKHNSLEIVNINSGVRQKYVISDRLLYTFNGLRKDEQYNIYMFSQAGLEIGRIENVVIPDQDISVAFDNLKSLHTVFAKVFASDGSEVTSQVSVEWLKPLADGTVTYLRRGVSLGEIPDGQQLICRVALDNKLGVVYANPEDAGFTVSADNNTCVINLAPFRAIELTGTIVDGDGASLYGASVSVNQTLNGKYSKTFTARTDRKGQWNLSVLDAPETRLTYAATECVNVNDTIGAFAADVNNLDLGKTMLKSIVGARVTYGFTYHAAGSDDVQDYYSDYQNVAVSVFNVTQNRAHKEISLQYPILAVLDENINVGDELKLTATSKTGAFNPIAETVTVDENQRAEVTFDIVGKGGIAASFEMTENPAVIAMLYSGKGELLKKMTYSEAKATFTELEDGDYTLVSMGQSDLMNSILRLSNFAEIGLTEGKDYVKNAVKVETGKLAEVKISEVPAFDESLFYYTNSTTSFSSNKSSITTGNYLTLRSAIDFKGVYKNDISNVTLIVDLPEACDFVEHSVIQGSNLLPYTLDNNRLTVQLGNNYQNQTRFCVIPTTGGSFNATASIAFDYNGRTITQPIGSATLTIKDLEILVPVVIADNNFKVTGTSVSQSSIEIIEENEIIGKGKSNSTGHFNIECTLCNPYNLSTHEIYARITTPSGNVLRSESKNLTYDQKAVKVKRVIMTESNNRVVFDFENPDSEDKYYYYSFGKFTFLIEFNSPKVVDNAILYIHTTSGNVVAYPATYDASKDVWFVAAEFDTNSLPLNVSVDFEAETLSEYDSRIFEDAKSELAYQLIESQEEHASFNEDIGKEDTFDEIDAIIEEAQSETTDYELLSNLIDSSMPEGISPKLITDEELAQVKAETEAVSNEWDKTYQPYLTEEIIDYVYADPEFDATADNTFIVPTPDGHKIIKQQTLNAIDEVSLLNRGFEAYTLSAGNKFYILITSNEIIVIDAVNLKEYSIVIEPSKNEQLHRVSGEVAGYAQCGKAVTQTVYDLSNINSDRPKAIKATAIITTLLDALKCYYDGLYAHSKWLSESKIADFLNKQSSLLKTELARQKVVSQHIEELNVFLRKGYGDYLNYQELIKAVEANPALSLAEKERQIKIYEGALDECLKRCEGYKKAIVQAEDVLKQITKNVKKFEKAIEWTKKAKDTIKKAYDACPAKLVRKMKMPKWLKIGGKAAGEFGIFIQVASFALNCWDIYDDLVEWCNLIDAIDAKIPCEADQQRALNLRDDIYSKSDSYFYKYLGIISGEIGSIGFSVAGGVPLVSPTWYLEILTWVATEVSQYNVTKGSKELRENLSKQINELKCNKENECGKPGLPACPSNDNGGNNGKTGSGGKGGDHQSGNTDTKYGIDPSGFVYEAVPENRVEGVQATIYYKETKEDMYGDPYEEVILWNAEEYAQQNPLFTDENGMYRWDVPQGLWQVKLEKDGYVTAYSEWLPVPPPQLEVNIGIVQNKQPEVTEARAYEEGVEVQFDKFMDLSTLTTANIYVTANGEKLNGEIRLIDSALADEYASEDDADAVRYASRIRFVPEEKLSATTGEIRVTVSRNVLSYAGIPMTETFSQVLDVEKEVQMIVADDVKVLYGGEKEVTVYAIPFEAAVGRTLHIANSSDLISSTDITEATLDDEGKAVVTVKGDFPGRTQLTFTIDDVTATGECAVDVVTEIITAEAPKSSRASGTAVYRGTKVELTTESKNATIYFTTDGSCPCDENGTRRKYTVPIIINDDTQILAMTSVGNGDDDVSETVEFNYTLKHSDMDFKMEKGWTWISHNMETAVASADFAADASVNRIKSSTQEVVRDPQLGMVGALTELNAAESYKIETSAATAKLRLSDVAWNPSTPIELNEGWNWLGYPVGQTMTVAEALSSTEAEDLDMVVGQNGFAQFDGEQWIGTLETMSPGMGYMYQSASAKQVVYNTSIVSNAAAIHAPGIASRLPLVADVHKYPSVMPVIANVCTASGTQLDINEYMVAAFCGSECRGVGRVVDGLVMLSVYGYNGDNITLRVTDAEGEVEYQTAVASLEFDGNAVGNVHSPYVVVIDGNSGNSAVRFDGNVKVFVEGDMLRISGIAPEHIGFVEIYNIDGHKLMHETSITESGIRVSTLPTGVYVVVVDGNGDYSYHKIAIR